MLFILQDINESDAMAVEIAELRYELDNSSEHSYIIAKSRFFSQKQKEVDLKNAIPVGTIEFVQSYLRHVHGVEHMRPIEVPKELRLPKFLLRNYQILASENIPKNSFKFIKDASVLKQPIYIGSTDDVPEDFYKKRVYCELPGGGFIDEPGHLYQVSDVLDIMAEYRVVVMDNKIIGIQFYDGNPVVMPNEREIKKIQEMVLRYSQSKTCPEAYGLDVAIVRVPNPDLLNRDLALIEVGPFVAMANYGCRGHFLPRLYQKGLRWYLKQNTLIQE